MVTRRTRKKKGWTLERGLKTLFALYIGIVILSELPSEVLDYLLIFVLLVVFVYPFYRFGTFKLNLIRNRYRNSSIKEVDAMSGLEFEYFLKPLFESKGYMAEVTQGSGDYGADLVLSRKGKKTVVQAKCYSSNIGVDAVQQVVAAMPVYHAKNSIVITNRYFTKQAKKLARANHVLLIDRDGLITMINHYQSGSSSILNRLLAPFRLRLDRD